jgi:hypothetical protein
MTRFLVLFAGMLVAGLPLAQRETAYGATLTRHACGAPAELIDDAPRLERTAQHLRKKLPITIVAIGGASTAGKAAGDGANRAYPHWLEEALRARYPGVEISVINKGIPRQTTRDMIRRFATDVYPHQPTLVVWETGTVDAVHGYDVEAFTVALEAGIDALHAHKSDVILMDMQFSPATASVINFEPYLEAMSRVADFEDVYLFRRFDVMKYWSDAGVFDFLTVPRDKRTALASSVYECLGERLAEAIDFATH